MTERRPVRGVLAFVAISSVTAWSARARAEEPADASCVAPRSLSVNVAKGRDEALARRVEREIISELRSTPASPCWRLRNGEDGPIVHVEVRWPGPTVARVVLVATTPRGPHYGIRDLDLQRLPKDGIPLAIAIATDELFETIGEQLVSERPPPVTPPEAPPATAVEARRPTQSAVQRRLGFGPAACIDVIGSDLVLVGSDTQLLVPLTTTLGLTLHVGARAAPQGSSRSLRTTGAWIGGAQLRIGPRERRTTFAVSAGMDALVLRVAVANDLATRALPMARVGLAASTAVTPNLRLTADGYIGGALSPVHVQLAGGPTRTLGEGLMLGGSVGIMASF